MVSLRFLCPYVKIEPSIFTFILKFTFGCCISSDSYNYQKLVHLYSQDMEFRPLSVQVTTVRVNSVVLMSAEINCLCQPEFIKLTNDEKSIKI